MKEVPPGGDIIDGKFVPEGVRIASSNWAMTHKKSLFGQDAELFRPERWLEADETRAAEMRRTVELIFGYGRWTCAGKSIAFLELNKIFVEVSSSVYGRVPRLAVSAARDPFADMVVTPVVEALRFPAYVPDQSMA